LLITGLSGQCALHRYCGHMRSWYSAVDLINFIWIQNEKVNGHTDRNGPWSLHNLQH